MIIRSLFFFIAIASLISCTKQETATNNKEQKQYAEYALVIHGGAGYTVRKSTSPEKEKAYKEKMQQALDEGYTVLESGGDAIDAVIKAITILEDSPLFNAGKGAVFDSEGKNKLDASIMDGATLNCGSVAALTQIKNPIKAARLVMEKIHHVFLTGEGATEFALLHGLEEVDDDYFHTQEAYDELINVQKREKEKNAFRGTNKDFEAFRRLGTVGAVALDKKGNIVAGTSTGGLTNKKFGRIGDVPVIGAGTYANNATCGVSCTGVGEFFIRTLAANEVHYSVKYEHTSLTEATRKVIHESVADLGGVGGVIALDKFGNVAWDFNTPGMFRAFKNNRGENVVELYGKE